MTPPSHSTPLAHATTPPDATTPPHPTTPPPPTGPAPATASVTCVRYCSKFSRNIRTRSRALASYAAGSAQVARGVSTLAGTPGTAAGTSTPNTGSFTNRAPSSAPERAARTIARVYESFIREPVPYGPPVQPVLTSHTFAPCFAIRSPSIRAYTPGCMGRNGAPKQAEKVADGSVTPRSVPATLAV